MHEQSMMIARQQGQATHPCEMFDGQITRIIHAVAFKRLLAAVAPPRHEIAIRAIFFGGPDQHLFMVATQADEAAVRVGLIPDQKVDHFFAVWATVDVIAEHDESSDIVGAMLLTGREKRSQLPETAMDVTDCEGE
jgi:hypothetical protein